MLFKKMFFLVLFIMTISSHAQVQNVVCQGTNVNAYTRVEAPTIFKDRLSLGKISTATFIVDYDEGNYYVPQDAREAFDYAVEIWSHLLTASKSIKIKVEFHASLQGANSLAETGIVTYRNNIANAQHANTQYAIALAKQIDQNVNYTNYDMTISFKSGAPWNYETNGIPITGQYDFVSVALHEIEHGLGFSGSMYVEGGVGGFGLLGYLNNLTGTYPKVYDRYGISGSQRLIEVTNSTTLKNLLTGGNVFFDGSSAKLANNNANVKLFAPSEWAQGTSFSHLDTTAFPSGNQNSLMKAAINYAEVIHSPGEIGLGILKDLGWQVNRMVSFSQPLSSTQVVKGSYYTVKWFDYISQPGDYINFELYKITTGDPMSLGDINTSLVPSNPGWTNNSFTWLVSNTLENGYYFIKAIGYNHAVDYGQSSIFIISNVPESPHFNPPGAQYPNPINVQLYTISPVSEIRYVIGNDEPNQNSTLYTPGTNIAVSTTMRIRAKSFLVLANNVKVASPVSDADYYISSNSFVMELETAWNNYGSIYKYSNGFYLSSSFNVGLNSSSIYRSYAQWYNIKSRFPAGAIVQSVEFVIPFYSLPSNTSIEFRYYNPPNMSGGGVKWNLIGEGNALSTMPAYSSTFNVQGFVSYIQNIINGTSYDYFGIGVKNVNENSTADFLNNIYPVKLRVYYRGNVEITQLDKDNVPFGHMGYWQGTYWENKNVPATVFKSGNITLKSDQNYKSGTTQKYQKWSDQSDVVNHSTFPIASGVNYFTANFNETYFTPIVKNYFGEAPTLDPQTDKVAFRDPWLVDELDGTYGMRNQGMSGGNQGIAGADWYERNSPLNFSSPDFSSYKGVFLNQGWPGWSPPYYSVGAISPQDIQLQHTGKTHRFYFQNWS